MLPWDLELFGKDANHQSTPINRESTGNQHFLPFNSRYFIRFVYVLYTYVEYTWSIQYVYAYRISICILITYVLYTYYILWEFHVVRGRGQLIHIAYILSMLYVIYTFFILHNSIWNVYEYIIRMLYVLYTYCIRVWF